MTEEDGPKRGEEEPEAVTISRPEDQIYQKLYLCDYLRELYEAAEEQNEPPKKRRTSNATHRRKVNNLPKIAGCSASW